MIKKLCFSLLFCLSTQLLFAQGFAQLGEVKYNNVYAILVGISNYKEIQKLDYADDDAQLLYDILVESFPTQKANFTILKDEQATQTAIKKGIYQACSKAKQGDLVVIYFSGHGDVMSVYGTDYGYFLAYDASASRDYEAGGSVNFDFVNQHANGAASFNSADVWLFTDACRSGKVINQQAAAATMSTLNRSFEKTTKFISCAAHELSFEDKSLEHGVFTYYLAKGLSGDANTDEQSTTLTIDEINAYLKREVRLFTKEKQTPKVSSSNEFKAFFTVNPSIASKLKESQENNDLAQRGKGEDERTKSQILLNFEKAILEDKLHGDVNSAYTLLKNAKQTVTSDDYTLMQEMLIDALIQRGQRNVNLFLNGRPMLRTVETFASSAADLNLACLLLGTTHYLYEETKDKALFFEAMVVIDENNAVKFKEAEQSLLTLQKKYPRAAYLNQGLAMLYIKTTESDKAINQLKTASEKVSTWNKPVNTAAYISIENGDLDKAKLLLQEAVELTNNNNDVQLLRVLMYNSNWEMQSAEKELALVMGKKSNYEESELLAIQAKINHLKGRITVAEELYKKAILKDPKNINLINELGEVYKADGDTLKAIACFEKVKQLDASNQRSTYNLAQLRNTANTSSKINYLNRSELLSFVDMKLSQGKTEEAIQTLKSAQLLNKFDPEIDYALGKAYYAAKNNAAAKSSLQNALKKSPYHFESIKSLAYILILEKKYTEADALIKLYDKNFKYSSKWKVFTYEAYHRMQNTNNQIFALEEAIKLDSTDTEAYKSLYRLQMDNANYNEAEAQYKKLKKLGGRMKDSLEFLNQLILSVEGRIDQGLKDVKSTNGLKLILKYDPAFLARMLNQSRANYLQLNYRVADIHLERYKKYTYCLQREDVIEYYRIKAMVLLEVGLHQEALDLFRQINELSAKKAYLGVAMAQYELGFSEENWLANFRRDSDLTGYNSKAIDRYKRMNQNKGYHNPGY